MERSSVNEVGKQALLAPKKILLSETDLRKEAGIVGKGAFFIT